MYAYVSFKQNEFMTRVHRKGLSHLRNDGIEISQPCQKQEMENPRDLNGNNGLGKRTKHKLTRIDAGSHVLYRLGTSSAIYKC